MQVENVTAENVRLGLEVNFLPAECAPESAKPEKERGGSRRVSGEVVYINREHRFVTVETAGPRRRFRESFKF